MSVDSWRLKVQHKSGFEYAGPVSSSYNEARMWPRNEARQAVLDAKVEVWPPARTYKYEDYWGTVVTAFDVHAPHEQLTVTASSTVETLPPGDLVPPGEGASWTDLEQHVDRWYEMRLPTRRTGVDDELRSIVADLRGTHGTPQEAAMAVCEFVRAEVAYVPGSTGVQSDALHAWAQRKGVCQDISHLAVGMLREMGLPARYVSGYLHPKPGATIGESVVGQSHAWVEWWAGRWTSFDPTNGIPIGERHVSVGRGREYADVPPLKGIYSGPKSTGQGVEVTITRLR
ncbi:transglutaminase-like putative cysteine protease [Actinoplanes lutulentus]|uniref:Transglutaminase-like putative cysteine protease n=1 Tax=Actinoplanes lutulentus TaxID=1287878 RepID=A0A327Z7K3_9ACTN|nr:transglutaminase family protein [Actinoplanes lutulentus]MBB2946034.1 transglutaminase-like putative cysteine protease [Actinoplanes lutulentus]RAK32725.1 transglutaminase-like putative cysteine protease [Actinoplanes lutulentus]